MSTSQQKSTFVTRGGFVETNGLSTRVAKLESSTDDVS